jgi:putative AdoMet-dependent methyltransferase
MTTTSCACIRVTLVGGPMLGTVAPITGRIDGLFQRYPGHMPRSLHADEFNHDPDAHGYDGDVLDEANPIRAGYARTLRWVVEHAAIGPDDEVLDLGTGTGNLAVQLPPARRLVCVDVSANMLELARRKVGDDAEYVQADLLEVLDGPDRFDAVVSTYAIHHLTAEEKTALVAGAAACLRPGGRLAVGDLMVASGGSIPSVRDRLGHPDVDALFDEEFAWELDRTLGELERHGFGRLTLEQLSDLSWGVAALAS